MKNEENTMPVTIGEMTAALRRFSRCTDNEYERLIMTEAADELQKVHDAWRLAERRAQLTQPKKAKVRKVKPAARPRLLTMIVEGGERVTVDYNNIRADRAYFDRKIREAQEKSAKGPDDTGECCICGYKIHSEAVSKLPECNDCGKKRTCQHVPRLGAYTRINCFLWEPETERRRDHE